MSMLRGGTTKLYEVNTISSADTTLLGQEKVFLDLDYSATSSNFKTQLSGHPIRAKLVYNAESSSALPAGAAVKWDTSNVGTGVKLAGDEEKLAGFVNAYVGSSGVAAGYTCWIVTVGPTKVIYGSGTVNAGTRLTSAASNRVKTIDTSSAADVAAQCGVALEAMSSAGTAYRALVDVQGY